jgi:hypothetical protein
MAYAYDEKVQAWRRLQVFRIGHDDNLACFLGVHRIYPIPLLPLVEIDR